MAPIDERLGRIEDRLNKLADTVSDVGGDVRAMIEQCRTLFASRDELAGLLKDPDSGVVPRLTVLETACKNRHAAIGRRSGFWRPILQTVIGAVIMLVLVAAYGVQRHVEASPPAAAPGIAKSQPAQP